MPSPYTSNYGVTVITTATATITEAAHNGHIILVNRAAGSTLALPATSGSGMRFRIGVVTALTGDLVINCSGTDLLFGSVFTLNDNFAPDGTADNKITLNGSTSGGDGGDFIDLVDFEAGKWYVSGLLHGAGTVVTPFGTIS